VSASFQEPSFELAWFPSAAHSKQHAMLRAQSACRDVSCVVRLHECHSIRLHVIKDESLVWGTCTSNAVMRQIRCTPAMLHASNASIYMYIRAIYFTVKQAHTAHLSGSLPAQAMQVLHPGREDRLGRRQPASTTGSTPEGIHGLNYWSIVPVLVVLGMLGLQQHLAAALRSGQNASWWAVTRSWERPAAAANDCHA
jgi:hypothetical protein